VRRPQEGRWAWRLGSVAGIDLYLHVTFVALLVWIAVSHLGQRHGLPGVAGALALNLAVFGVVVLHELGHALVARRFGINTRDITLWPIGGIARLERMPEKPRQELLVAAAGPAVNFALAGLLAGLMFLVGQPLAPGQVQLVGGSFLSTLLWINVSLGLFNLLPAFPMDGGRILRAALALRLDRERATAVAARIGKGMAVLLGVLGLLAGHTILVIIAIFVWMGAHGESAAAAAKAALSGVPVSRTMITEFRTLQPQDSISTAAGLLVAGFQSQFPVLRDGRPVGVLTQADIVRAIADQRPDAPVDAFMTGNFSLAAPDEAVDVVLDRFQTPDLLVMVVDDDRLVGLLTAENIGEVVALGRAGRRRSPAG
jgi:Zn-dependent protease/CBS domain-containing protein